MQQPGRTTRQTAPILTRRAKFLRVHACRKRVSSNSGSSSALHALICSTYVQQQHQHQPPLSRCQRQPRVDEQQQLCVHPVADVTAAASVNAWAGNARPCRCGNKQHQHQLQDQAQQDFQLPHRQQWASSLQHQQLQLLASGDDRSTPEPPAVAGSPQSSDAGSSKLDTTPNGGSSNNSNSSSTHSPQEQGSQSDPPKPDALAQAGEGVEAAVDKMLDRTWQELKRDLKKEMSPEQAAMIDKWEVADIQTDKVFRDIAEQQLGPILQVMGIQEDPYAFFLDMFKLALMLQLGSAAVVFYGAEFGLGLDAGDAFRAVMGLFLGYFLRLGIKIEHLAWPLYNAFVQLMITDDTVYEYPAATAEEKQDTLNKLGLVIASVFLVPKFLFGWQNDECWQIMVPMVFGLFFFDVCYIMALLIKCWTNQDSEDM